MHPQDQFELNQLKARQKGLESEIASLGVRIGRLEGRLESSQAEAAKPTANEGAPDWVAPRVAPPVPPPIPILKPVLPQTARVLEEQRTEPQPVEVPPLLQEVEAATNVPLQEVTAPRQVSASAAQGSFEMRFGTHWAPRIGIVLVLTALVFFGNFAYQNYIARLGAGGKVTLMYLGSALLLGAGAWWQRRAAKESLRNYAQVLFAGGLAAVYFTTYAAHHIEALRIIQSPLIDGLLLLGWAGFTVWLADHKKSEVLAMFAVGLAYYSSIMTRVGSFTLYSNLLLTVAAVVFLVRNRWAMLSFASLAATYASYVFWRFFDGSAWSWPTPEAGLWQGAWFLISYWVVFTAAVFLSRHEKLAGQARAMFLTINNGVFFGLFLLTMIQVREGGLWKVSLIFGSVLLGLSVLARQVLQTEPLAKQFYLTQGLLLVTVGFIAKFSGMQLALLLGAESVMLLVLGQKLENRILRAGSYACALLGVAWAVTGMREFDREGLIMGIGVGLLILVNTLLAARREAQPDNPASVRVRTTYFTGLMLLTWLVAAWRNTPQSALPLVLAGLGVALSLSIYGLKAREITVLAQVYLVLAQIAWLANRLDAQMVMPEWNTVALLLLTVGLLHWWQHQNRIGLPQLSQVLQAAYAAASALVVYLWLVPKFTNAEWVAVTSGLAVGLTLYGVATRAWWIAGVAQGFLAASGVCFAWHLQADAAVWHYPLAPIAALLGLSFGCVQWFRLRPGQDTKTRESLLQVALAYRWVALGMAIWWICRYISERERIWVLAFLGLGVFLWAGWQRNREALAYGAVFTGVGMVLFWWPLLEAGRAYLPNLVAVLVMLAQRQLATRFPDRFALPTAVHNTVIIVGGLSLWLFLTLWVREDASGFYLTASWSLLALVFFTAGIVLRERMYRWLGLALLGCTLGRIVVFDVWKLETLFRILSFMALGIVLLVLGFIYNRYQEKIRQWL